MSEIVRLDPKEEQLDNTIYPVDQGLYIADNGRIISEFYQVDNEVVVNSKGRRISWSPYDMRYIDEFGMEDPVFTVQEVPLETKANYARYNRAMPDVDDWFIQENDRLKHQILIQGFQPDPSPWLFGNIDFAIGGKMKFDSDLRIMADGIEQVNPFETKGAIHLYEGEELIFELPEVIAFDSAYDRSMTFGKYRVWFDENGEMMFDIIVDYGWMTAPERVYPVVIDPTVIVSSGYRTANSGRKIVQCDDNMLVTAIRTISAIYFFKSIDNGQSWSQICYCSGSNNDVAIVDNEEKIHVFYVYQNGNKAYQLSFDRLTQPNVDISSTKTEVSFSIIANPKSIDAYIDKVNRVIHVGMPDTASLWYVRANVSENNVVTLNPAERVVVRISSSYQFEDIAVTALNNIPVLSFVEYASTTSGYLGVVYKSGTSWVKRTIYNGERAEPTICHDKNDRIHLSFRTNFGGYQTIMYTYSDDEGSTWSALSAITTGANFKSPTLTVSYENEIYLFYQSDTEIVVRKSTDRGATWTAHEVIKSFASSVTLNPKSAFDGTFTDSNVSLVFADGTSVYYEGVILNRPPNAPSNLTRSNFDATESTIFTWNYSDPDPLDSQSAFQIQILDVLTGLTVMDSGKVASLTSSYSLASNAIENGKQYQWRVKTWDNSDMEGAWSDYATFYTSGKPSVAITNLTDGQIYPINSLTLEWNMSDPESEGQSAYQARILNMSDAVLLDTGKVIDARSRARTLNYELLNGTSYKITLSVWDGKDVKSNEQTMTINVDYTEPAQPILTTSTDATRGTITVHIEHPTPVFPEPTVINTDIYRRKLGETSWERIGVGVDPAFIDYTPSSEQIYEYKVRGWGDNQIYTDSEIISESVKIPSSQLSMVSDYSKIVHMKYNPARSETDSRDRVVSHFAGRQDPVAEFGDSRNSELGMSFVLNDITDLNMLRHLADSGQTLLYRDNRGRKMFCSVGQIQIDDQQNYYYQVSVPMTKVSYTEEV